MRTLVAALTLGCTGAPSLAQVGSADLARRYVLTLVSRSNGGDVAPGTDPSPGPALDIVPRSYADLDTKRNSLFRPTRWVGEKIWILRHHK